jgi:hypothetical protein
MYTTADKLAETIALQQRLLRQAFAEPNTTYVNQLSKYAPQNEYHTIKTNASNKNPTSYEWKVNLNTQLKITFKHA